MFAITRSRISLRDGMLAIVLVALVFVAVIQGRKVADLETRLQQVQAQSARIQAQNTQLANGTIRFQQQVMKDGLQLRREVEKLKQQSSPAKSPER